MFLISGDHLVLFELAVGHFEDQDAHDLFGKRNLVTAKHHSTPALFSGGNKILRRAQRPETLREVLKGLRREIGVGVVCEKGAVNFSLLQTGEDLPRLLELFRAGRRRWS